MKKNHLVLCFSLILISFFFQESLYAQCGCTHIIYANSPYVIDGNTFKALDGSTGVKPGDKVCFSNGPRYEILLQNFHGTKAQPITFSNMCDGKVTFRGASAGAGRIVYVGNSSFLHFTGGGNPNEQYGIEITIGVQAIDFRDLSTNVEVDHLYIHDIGYSAINAKTDASCDPATWRGNFTLRDIIVHDNFIKNTGGEAIYIGESHYHTTFPVTCNGVVTQQLEHEAIGVHVYNNKFENIGRDAIQVGSTTSDCSIHHNTIVGFGTAGDYGHQSGIQINPGTNTECYNNIIDTGTGFGIFAGGRGGSHIYNNIIVDALQGGILGADYDPVDVSGFIFSNNIIVNCNDYGIYMYSERTIQNQFVNNIIVAGGTTYAPSFTYVRLNTPAIKWTESNNIKTANIGDLKFVNPSAKDFRLLAGSPAIDAGKDMSAYGITFDLDEKTRPKDSKFDIGPYEFDAGGPAANAGVDQSLTLPTNSITLNGSGTSGTGVTGYQWTKKSGGAATLENEATATLSVAGMVEGTYVFELQVTDASGFDFDEVTVNVLPEAANQNPTAKAGVDRTITLPTNSLTLNGIGTDPDGTIASYLWTKVTGPAATLLGQATANLALSDLVEGDYVFRLTVTDDKSATASDQVAVKVKPEGVNQLPVVNAGTQKTIFLPASQVAITATASDPDGTIQTILWEKKSGGAATLSNTGTLTLTASDLVLGSYSFRVTVTDNGGATSFSDVIVKVLQANQSPTANAGDNQPLTLPTNTVILAGSGDDPDGTISIYAWTKVSGPAASLSGENSATLTVTNMVQGAYVFGLTITDNNGATGYDEVTVAVSVASTGPNESPLAIAGGNASFSLPTNSLNLYGSGFDPDGTIVTYAWAKASGGPATLANTNKPTLTVSALQAGQYTFRLTVTDDKGATDEDIAIVTVSDLGTNIFPIASAGADKIVKLPQTSVVLNGSGTDMDGQVTSFEWIKISGGSATIGSASKAETPVSNLAEGIYVFRLTITDNAGATDLNDVTVRVVSSTNNLPPVVDAGEDATVFLPQVTHTFDATASDDGTITTYEWAKLNGPGATLVNPTELDLSLNDLVEGDYSFQLAVTDNNAASVFDIVKVSVLPASFKPTEVNAGPDQELALPMNSVTLTGTASSSSGTIVSTTWVKTLGPAANLSGDNTLTLQVTDMEVGTYVFKLTAIDNAGKEVSDNVQVIVNPVPPNKPPVVDAGINKAITLPVSGVTLTGTATDTDGMVTGVAWTQVQGPNSATLQDQVTLTLNATGLIPGTYIFRLSATDDEGDVGYNDAIVFVAKEPRTTDEPPIAYAGDDVVLILPESETTIIGEGFDPDGFIETYEWEQMEGSPANLTATSHVLNLKDLVEGEYVFRLTVTDTASLTSFDDVRVSVIDQSDEIPKFFSPNEDGIGDMWSFRNSDNYSGCTLKVFNRTGKEVYAASPYQNNWNGLERNGTPVEDGDYYYVLLFPDGRQVKGALRVIR